MLAFIHIIRNDQIVNDGLNNEIKGTKLFLIFHRESSKKTAEDDKVITGSP